MFKRKQKIAGLVGMLTFLILAKWGLSSVFAEEVKILSVAPRGAPESIGETSAIIVSFNQPMVSLQKLPQGGGTGPLLIRPKVSGKYRWMGTRTLVFLPQKGRLPYGTNFTVTVPRGISSISGQILKQDFSWSLETPRPKLIYHWPRDKNQWINLNEVIILQFNQKMPLEEARDFLELTGRGPEGRKTFLPFDVRHLTQEEINEQGLRAKEGEILLLKPEEKFKPGYFYQVKVLKGLPGIEGPLGMSKNYKFSFSTYGLFRFLNIEKPHLSSPGESIALNFSNPVSYREIATNISFQPEVEIPEYYYKWDYSSSRIHLWLNLQPDTLYTVTLSPNLKDRFGNPLDEKANFTFTTGPYSPWVSVSGRWAVLEAYGSLLYPVTFMNIGKVRLRANSLEVDKVIPLLSQEGIFRQGEPIKDIENFLGTSREWTTKKSRNQEVVDFIKIKDILGQKKYGAIFAELFIPEVEKYERYRRVFIQVTEIGITAKFSSENNLIWLTELKTAAPLKGALVEIRDDFNKVFWRGRTDSKGLVRTPGWKALGIKAKREGEKPRQWAFVRRGEDTVFINSDWGTGIFPYQFGISYDWQPLPQKLSGYLFTERGLYRPGEEVHLKAIVREKRSGKWEIPETKEAWIFIRNSRDEEILKKKVTLSSYGSFFLSFTLAKDAPSGYYRIQVSPFENEEERNKHPETNFDGAFRVEDFRPANFEVSVRTDKESYVFKDSCQVTIEGSYLFGAAMSGEKVSWKLRLNPTRFSPRGYKGYFFGPGWWEEDDKSQLIDSGEGKLDSSGRFYLEKNLKEVGFKGSANLRLEAVVTDLTRQSIASRTTVVVHRGGDYIGIKPSTTFTKEGREVKIKVIAVNPQGEVIPGKKLQLRVLKREWYSKREARPGGRWRWISKKEDKEKATYQMISGAKPLSFSFSPESAGLYLLEARGEDSRGNKILTGSYFYASGKGYGFWEKRKDDRIELVADANNYHPGDRAKILVKSPYEKAKALITLEREGILESWVEEIKGTADTLEIPITRDYIPNVFVSVILLKGRLSQEGTPGKEDFKKPSFKIGYIDLSVDPTEKRLQVEVIPDKAEYSPQDKVRIAIKVRNSAGEAVSSEISVAVVDLGVLNLIGYKTPDAFTTFYRHRPLSVKTSETRSYVIEETDVGTKGRNPGGDGGMEKFAGIAMRERLIPTAYWNPSVEIGPQGWGEVSFELPDNLTTFKVMVTALTKDSFFGSGEEKLVVKKPLLLKSALPGFARRGDSFEAGVVVYNYTGEEGEVQLLGETEGITLKGKKVKTVFLRPGESREVRFSFEAHKIGEAKFFFKAIMGEYSDGLAVTIPVNLPRQTESVALFGSSLKDAYEEILIPEDSYPDIGEVKVAISPTILFSLKNPFASLLNYPYQCLEQRLSRIFPLILLKDMPETFDFSLPEGKSPERIVKQTLKEVSLYQRPNGGFSFWQDSSYDSPYLTSYTLFILKKAEEAGYEVPSPILEKGAGYLKELLHGKLEKQKYPYNSGSWRSSEAFALYVLSLLGKPEPAYIERLYRKRDEIPLFARTFLVKAIHLGQGNRKMEENIVRDLMNKIKVSPTSAYFEGEEKIPWVFDSRLRTTAMILQTLIEIEKEPPVTPQIVRWLIKEQQNRWLSTQDNAYLFYALADYFHRYEEKEPEFRVKVRLAGKNILEHFFRKRIQKLSQKTVAIASLEKGEKLPLEIYKDGEGRMYYEVRMNYAPTGALEPRDEGIAVFKSFETLEGKRIEDSFPLGDLVVVNLKVVISQARHFVVVDDPLPAGFAPVNLSFETESREVARQIQEKKTQSWWQGFRHMEMYNEKVLLFADYLRPGIHTHTYLVRATTPGTYGLPGTEAEEMYTPEVFGRSMEKEIVIK
ncbi:MAG: Ig-like domain-containing protein [bacterium]